MSANIAAERKTPALGLSLYAPNKIPRKVNSSKIAGSTHPKIKPRRSAFKPIASASAAVSPPVGKKLSATCVKTDIAALITIAQTVIRNIFGMTPPRGAERLMYSAKGSAFLREAAPPFFRNILNSVSGKIPRQTTCVKTAKAISAPIPSISANCKIIPPTTLSEIYDMNTSNIVIFAANFLFPLIFFSPFYPSFYFFCFVMLLLRRL
jgi:hypothetical protein